ncbi:MAG: class I SAM-dependent methyltransferase [Candidatus Promineifilaceae bacterium]|jgi:SAM-dependent methyltransferase
MASKRYKQVTDDLRLAYDGKAEDRNQKSEPAWKESERLEFLELLQQEGKKSLLEIGAGAGWDSLFFQGNGLKVVSSDLSPEMVHLCREKGLEAYEMDFLHLKFSDNRFEAVYARNCLLHVPKESLVDVLQEIRRVMTPGGLFFLGMYGGINQEGPWDEDEHIPKRYFAFYQDDQIKAITRAYFSLRSFKTIPQPNSELHFQRLILQKPLD